MRSQLAADFETLAQAAGGSPYTAHLQAGFKSAKNHVTTDILGTNNYLN